jgi:hypothetical protein
VGFYTRNPALGWCAGLSLVIIPLTTYAGDDWAPAIATLGYSALFSGTGLVLHQLRGKAA